MTDKTVTVEDASASTNVLDNASRELKEVHQESDSAALDPPPVPKDKPKRRRVGHSLPLDQGLIIVLIIGELVGYWAKP